MTREAFDLSERFGLPVMVRLVTRLCHSRAVVAAGPAAAAEPAGQDGRPPGLDPAAAQRPAPVAPPARPAARRARVGRGVTAQRSLGRATPMLLLPSSPRASPATTSPRRPPDLGFRPPHLHVGAYPPPEGPSRRLAAGVRRLLVIEEGYPFLERQVRGVLPDAWEVTGRESGALPLDGELTPDLVRAALGPARPAALGPAALPLPGRPPQLCRGCPHADSYEAVRAALAGFPESVVTSDIGCYTLGALPPYSAIESCVCMGASVGMAKGAADAGLRPVLAVIGDSTFLHSGVTPLMDAVAASTPMTLLILDNGTVAMTGLQPTVLPGSSLEPLLLGLGVDRSTCT